jgi:hypothetical protein
MTAGVAPFIVGKTIPKDSWLVAGIRVNSLPIEVRQAFYSVQNLVSPFYSRQNDSLLQAANNGFCLLQIVCYICISSLNSA